MPVYKSFANNVVKNVLRTGLEPMTYGLEGRCSIQLSYRSILFCGCKYIKNTISEKRRVSLYFRVEYITQ